MSKSQKLLPIIIGLFLIAAVAVAAWWFLRVEEIPLNTDTTIEGDHVIEKGERLVITDSATLTVTGDLKINGEVTCENGPITLVVEGDLNVTGELNCALPEELPEGSVGNNIMIIAKGTVNFSASAVVVANGHVQVADDINNLALTNEEIEALYDDVGKDTGDGFRLGPMVPVSGASQLGVASRVPAFQKNGLTKTLDLFVSPASAQDDVVPTPDTVFGGTWVVGNPTQTPPSKLSLATPPPDINRIILNFNFGNKAVTFQDFDLWGPDGRDGESDLNTNCEAVGLPGENAFRFKVMAENLEINNFDLHLGNGGKGGEASNPDNCDPGIATGGNGGEPGNFKMVATNNFEIKGDFTIWPGVGGEGGSAYAKGKDGEADCPGKDGGAAIATGGNGGLNDKGLKVSGSVGGLENVLIESVFGGEGGYAVAEGGQGGDGNGCGCAGGRGGDATANGGHGGNASSKSADSYGGNGGDSEAIPGTGGKGGDCDPSGAGGNGGPGGDARADGGNGGVGSTDSGQDGTVRNETGGNGGNGGDGCPEGKGGAAGLGLPDGQPGADGTNNCVKPEAATAPAEDKTSGSTGTSGSNDTGTNTTSESGSGNETAATGGDGTATDTTTDEAGTDTTADDKPDTPADTSSDEDSDTDTTADTEADADADGTPDADEPTDEPATDPADEPVVDPTDVTNEPPVAWCTTEPIKLGYAGQIITFISLSTDDGEIVWYDWDFGDGNTDSGEFAMYSYPKPGGYSITLTVYDDGDLMDSGTCGITIVDEADYSL